jgi:hypothetical protein
VGWGAGSLGQTNSPASLTNVSAIASGGFFNLAVRENGLVVPWGYNGTGQTNLPPGLTNVAAVACGNAFALALGNQPPRVGSLTVTGYVNHDLALALPATDPDGNPFNLRLLTLPAAGTLYQSSNGQRGTVISATNTLVSDSAGQVVFVAATNATGNPYATFAFRAEDAFYRSTNADAQVIIAVPASAEFACPAWDTSGQMGLAFTGSSNATYSLWASSDLTNWLLLGIPAETAPGQYQWLDATATNYPKRFYRTTAP